MNGRNYHANEQVTRFVKKRPNRLYICMNIPRLETKKAKTRRLI